MVRYDKHCLVSMDKLFNKLPLNPNNNIFHSEITKLSQQALFINVFGMKTSIVYGRSDKF